MAGIAPLLGVAARCGFATRPWLLATDVFPLVARYGAGVDTVMQVSSRRFARRVAVVDDAGETTYAELWGQAARIARGLVARVPRPAEASTTGGSDSPRALVLVRPRVQPLSAIAGALRAGFEVVPVAAPDGADALRRLLHAHEPRVVIADAHDVSPVRDAGFTGVVIDQSTPTSLARPSETARFRRGRLALLTSGTTGLPQKVGVPATTLAHVGALASLFLASGVRGRRAVTVLTPLHHGHGLSAAIAGLLAGGTVVLGQGIRGVVLQDLLDRHSPAAITLVPTQLVRMLADGVTPPPSVRRILSGSAPLSAEHADAARAAWGDVLVNAYGSTETGTLTRSTPRQASREPATAGRPLPGIRIAVTNASGRPVARGEVGEIRVCVAASRRVRRTHDVGWMSPAGLLHVTARRDRVVVSGGENVSLARVEAALEEHPCVAVAAAWGEADAEFGQVVCATATVASDADPNDAPSVSEVRVWLATRLERFEIPKRIELRRPE